MRATTATELAAKSNLPPPMLTGWHDLPGFVAAYESARALIRTLDDLRRVACEVVQDNLADGFVWSEIHVSPLSYSGRLGRAEAVLEAVLQGFQDATAAGKPAGAAVILGHDRAADPEEGNAALRLAIAYQDHGVVGLGLVGDERHPGDQFAPLFQQAVDHGLASVPHAGETGTANAVRQAIVGLGADRIGHGIAAIRDDAVIDLLVERDVYLDVCPTSNLRLGLVDSLARHPVRSLVEAGVKVSINSDDPTFFGSCALNEYALADTILGLDVGQVARWSVDASCAPDAVKLAAKADLDEVAGR